MNLNCPGCGQPWELHPTKCFLNECEIECTHCHQTMEPGGLVIEQ